MFYNDKVKTDFIEHMKNSYGGQSRSIFAASSPMEEELGKDMYDFNLVDLGKLMGQLGTTTVNASRTKYYVMFNYINFYKHFRADKSNPFLLVEPNWHEQFVDKTERSILTETELDKIIEQCVNAQDALTFRLLFEGLWRGEGPAYSELLNLKENDINWEKNSLYLNDGVGERELKVSGKCIDLLKRAIKEKNYFDKNGKSKGYIKKRPLIESDYVIRGVDPGLRNVEIKDRYRKFLVSRRVAIIKEVFKYSKVTPATLRYSGMVKLAVDISAANNVPVEKFNHKDHWSKVAERFNVNHYKGIYKGVTDNINSEDVKDLYGELVDYKVKDFELVENDKSDVETIERKKRIDGPAFKDSLIKIYDKCVITDESFSGVLEGCHIQPYVKEESNHIQNGLLLRADIHKLFDDGYIIIDENYIVRVSSLLKSDYYKSFNGKKINLPKEKRYYPSQKALKDKMNFFKRADEV
ncbi:HNH endonuclease [Peribacillus sp. NPDC058075]|uniref:phage lytic cycle repressor MrpR family protein n=1 Tax=unclassified Peribacillus TaxID=2675266 RepID=UPI0036DD42A6